MLKSKEKKKRRKNVKKRRKGEILKRNSNWKKELQEKKRKEELENVSKKDKCQVCAKLVLPYDKVIAEGNIYHTGCFKCNYCLRHTKTDNYAIIDGAIYCKLHAKLHLLDAKRDSSTSLVLGTSTFVDGDFAVISSQKVNQQKSPQKVIQVEPKRRTTDGGSSQNRSSVDEEEERLKEEENRLREEEERIRIEKEKIESEMELLMGKNNMSNWGAERIKEETESKVFQTKMVENTQVKERRDRELKEIERIEKKYDYKKSVKIKNV